MSKEYHNTPQLTTSVSGVIHKKTLPRKTLDQRECQVLALVLSAPVTTYEIANAVFTTHAPNQIKAINDVFVLFALRRGWRFVGRVITSTKASDWRYVVSTRAKPLLTLMYQTMCTDCTEGKP